MLDSATLSTSSSSEEEEVVVRDNGKEPDPSLVPYEFVKMGEIITIGRPRRKFDVSFIREEFIRGNPLHTWVFPIQQEQHNKEG